MKEKLRELIRIWRITYSQSTNPKLRYITGTANDQYIEGKADAFLEAANELEDLLEEEDRDS